MKYSNFTQRISIFLIASALFYQVQAQDYEAGRSAYISGNYGEALRILEPLAESGDSEAQKIMGIMYDYGHGVNKDPSVALQWYLRSAEQGQPAVQYQVGAKYFRGDGTEQNYPEAAKWWELAANGGQVDAQFNLGLMHYRGLSMERDDRKAAELFEKAAAQGHSYAQYSLAVMYSFGHGVEKDHASALEWFRSSANQGVAQAQFNMGVYYENGYAVDKDLDVARQWYERASAQGLIEAQSKIDQWDSITNNQDSQTIAGYSVEDIATDGNVKREAWVLSQSPNSYTLQIGSVVNEQDMVNFIQQNNIESDTAYIRVNINGITRYNALYGVYDDYNEANDAIAELPRSIRNIKPWVRNFGVLHKLLN